MLFCLLREEMEVVLQNQDFRSVEIMETNLQIHRNEVSGVSETLTINLKLLLLDWAKYFRKNSLINQAQLYIPLAVGANKSSCANTAVRKMRCMR